jgi:hypothetical protein
VFGGVIRATAGPITAVGFAGWYFNPNANGRQHQLSFVIRPGNSVLFKSAVVNQALTMSMQWRERRAQPAEL